MSLYIEDKGLRIYLHEKVYEPKEDSFLMLDTVIKEDWNTNGVLEVGSGTGYVCLMLASKYEDYTMFAVDINYHAAKITHQNATVNQLSNVLVICGDLTTAFRKNSQPKICIFNPPYLPEDPTIDLETPVYEYQQLIGGTDGYETACRFLDALVSSEQIAYLILSSLATTPTKFAKLYPDWKLDILASSHLGFETIWILRLTK
ncbi:MAG: HemK2/MTQ2 family protein methyltransferase [Candidatus Kariarchaeaceae archaeon]